jgi:hypothetical protein
MNSFLISNSWEYEGLLCKAFSAGHRRKISAEKLGVNSKKSVNHLARRTTHYLLTSNGKIPGDPPFSLPIIRKRLVLFEIIGRIKAA